MPTKPVVREPVSPPTVKYSRGKNPISQKNLKPFPKGVSRPPGPGGMTVTHWLKRILAELSQDGETPNARAIAEKIIERSSNLTGKSDAAILAQLLDRTEGRIQPDATNINITQIAVTIHEAPPPGQVVEGEAIEGEQV